MSTLQMDIGGGTSPRFVSFSSGSCAHPTNPNNNCEEVAIDYSKPSTSRMSPDEGEAPVSYRVPTKGMRKAYPEDQFVASPQPQPQLPQQQQQPPQQQQQPQQVNEYQTHANNSPSVTTFPKIMDNHNQSPYAPPPPAYHSHENTPSPYYPTPPPQVYTGGGEQHNPHGPHYHQHNPQMQQQAGGHNRFNFNVYHELAEEMREYQCLKCGLFFSCQSDLHMHYTHDHGYGNGQHNVGGGERSSTSSTSSSGGGSHQHHINNRQNHNNSTSSSRTSGTSTQDMFCDKCQLRFHCLLSFRVHQHEHVLPNVQPHYPMSNSHLLSLSYTCEICGTSFMSRESLTDHANAHLYEHVCSEFTCGGEISDQSTATNSSEDFYHTQQRESVHIHPQHHLNHASLQYQRNCYNQSQLENGDHSPPIPRHHFPPHHQLPIEPEEQDEPHIAAQTQGPNVYSNQPEYSTSSPYPPTQQDHQLQHHQQHEITPPISSSKLPGGAGIYEPLIVMDNGKRRFQCVICKKYLSSRIAHEEHTRGKHTGDKPYRCSYCGKRFAVWNTYKHHMGTHKGGLAPPLQKCGLCEKRFKTVECLRNHMQREHNIQGGGGLGGGNNSVEAGEGGDGSNNGGGYSCQICGKTFIRKMWRTRHYLSHEGQNCFRCELCSCILPDEQSYRIHHESHKVSN